MSSSNTPAKRDPFRCEFCKYKFSTIEKLADHKCTQDYVPMPNVKTPKGRILGEGEDPSKQDIDKIKEGLETIIGKDITGADAPLPMTAAELYKARKFKLHMIPQELILEVLMGSIEITSFLPMSCLADIGYKIDTQGLAILVCHESYEPVPLDSIPEIMPCKHREVK